MDGMDGVMEPVESGSEVVETEVSGSPEGGQPETGEDESPYSSKSSREYSQWLKALRDSDPNNAKWAKLSKENHARLYQLQQLEGKGLDGVREKYALLDSVVHGELKGADAIGAIQDQLREIEDLDSRLISGDPTALDDLGEEFAGGLAKLAPHILDRVQQTDPEAYANAVLPHFVEALRSSELVRDFNGMIDAMNEAAPGWLTADQKQAWQAERMQKMSGFVGRMAQWFNSQDEKAKALKQGNPQGRASAGSQKEPDERQKFEKERSEYHWNTNIKPGLDKHAGTRFQELMRPYMQRLKLDGAASNGLKQAFIQGVVRKAGENRAYMDQIGRYHSQKAPDPGTVLNFAKVEFDKHAKAVMEGLVKERYGAFLNGKPKAAQPNGNGSANGKPAGPAGPNVQVVSVKPPMNEIDHKNTPLEWLHQKKYRLNSGKIVQVR